MSEAIADALVLTFTRGMGLADWQRSGLLEREWALYARLGERYRRIVLVTWGGPEDRAVLERCASMFGPSVSLLCNDEQASQDAYRVAVIERAAALLGDARSIVVKTNQMVGGELAVRLTRRLRERGHRVGLVARGGYLVSRFESAEHGPASPEARRAGGEEAELCRAADLVVGTSAAMIGDLSWRYGLETHRTREIPNFVIADDRTALSHDPEARTPGSILYAGQLVERKRVDILIRGVSELPAHARGQARLTIVGEGPDEPRLRALADELGVPACFEPRLPHEQLRQVYRRTTIYAQMSRLEGHPKTVLEAMAAGCAVVVAQAPGMSSCVQHGVTGLVVPPSPEVLAHTLEVLMGDEEMRLSFGLAAQEHATRHYGLDRVVTLEAEAHAFAIARGGDGAAVPSELVRWDPELLNVEPRLAAKAIAASAQALARRMESGDGDELLGLLLVELRDRVEGQRRRA